ncbi:MAG TPA: nucleotidyltransferase [Phycisphaerae bacterium]|nr:nucleotidyltransferase [Phycisphaerae bacterium]
MTPNAYLRSVISKYRLPTGDDAPVTAVSRQIARELRLWARPHLRQVVRCGSFAKGTAIHGCADLDLLLSFDSATPGNLRMLYGSLFNYLAGSNRRVRQQNVSIGVLWNGFRVDLIPAKRQAGQRHVHSLYVRKADTWIQTNVALHVALVRKSKRASVIILAKIWRQCHRLDFPSIYLELSVLRALKGKGFLALPRGLAMVLEYLADDFVDAQIEDPANTNNIISDCLTKKAKEEIAGVAQQCLWASCYNILW